MDILFAIIHRIAELNNITYYNLDEFRICVCLSLYIYVHIYMYIYIYIILVLA